MTHFVGFEYKETALTGRILPVCLTIDLVDSLYIENIKGSDCSGLLEGTPIGQFPQHLILLDTDVRILPEADRHSKPGKVFNSGPDSGHGQVIHPGTIQSPDISCIAGKRSGLAWQTDSAQEPQTVEREAPWAVPNMADNSWPS